MTTIDISEIESDSEYKYKVAIRIDSETHYSYVDRSIGDDVEDDFDWYFEDFIREPYYTFRANECRKKIKSYGLKLFDQLFQTESALEGYRAVLIEEGVSNLSINVQGVSPEFHSIHWEALFDPEFNVPLAIKGISIVRSSNHSPTIPESALTSNYLNLLIVTARPKAEYDIDYRTIQRPIVELTLESAPRVKVHILRPGTFKSFLSHLEETPDGYYHIIHFDLHGGLFTHDDLILAKSNNQFSFEQYNFSNSTFQVRFGVDELEKYDDYKAFLLFESGEKHISIPFEASELAKCLEIKQVPICFLNACQSAKQTNSANETSLAKILANSGIHLVLAMQYSISATAATVFMKKLYEELLEGQTVEHAIAAARMNLFDEKSRMAYLGQKIKIDDWLLPVTFKNKDYRIRLTDFENSEQDEIHSSFLTKHNDPTELKYGFHGRDFDIQQIEKMLITKNHLLVHGRIGSGKSTLLRHLKWWWGITGFLKAVIYLNDREQSITLQLTVDKIASQILKTTDCQMLAYKPKELQKRVIQELNSNSYGIIFDHIFRINDQELIDFLRQIQEPSIVVYGSTNAALLPLGDTSPLPNSYCLEGLDKDSAYQFARFILESNQVDYDELFTINHFNLKRLMTLTQRLPAEIENIFSQVSDSNLDEILNRYNSGTI